MRALVASSVALMFGAAACSLVADFNGYTGSPDAGAGIEASTNDGTTAMPMTVDAGSIADASDDVTDAIAIAIADAEAGVDATEPPFCANNPGHTFCDDFDTSSMLAATWSKNLQSGGTVDLDTSQWVSPGQSLIAKTITGSGSKAVAEQGYGPTTTAEITAKYRVTGSYQHIEISTAYFQINADLNYANCYIDVSVDTGTATIDADCQSKTALPDYTKQAMIATIPNGQWVTIDVLLDTSAHQVTATIGSAHASIALPAVAAADLTLGAGVGFANGPAVVVNVDDVLIDVH